MYHLENKDNAVRENNSKPSFSDDGMKSVTIRKLMRSIAILITVLKD
jgi:hypothetical protein